jgi:hypothetical protein
MRSGPRYFTNGFDLWLKASYQYEVLNDPIMSDSAWDALGKYLADNWDRWGHPHKHLTDRESIGATACNLNGKWPDWVVRSDRNDWLQDQTS